MSALLLIPIAAFACCALVYFYLARQVRRILVSRHPEVWLDISSKVFFLGNAVQTFVVSGTAQQLDDAELLSAVRRVRRVQFVGFALWVIGVVGFSLKSYASR